MAVDVSAGVYEIIKAQRDNAAMMAQNSATIIEQETGNKENWEQQADELTEVLADLRIV